jgi:hypothetical protein
MKGGRGPRVRPKAGPRINSAEPYPELGEGDFVSDPVCLFC